MKNKFGRTKMKEGRMKGRTQRTEGRMKKIRK